MAADVDAIFARLSESGRSFSNERTLFLRAWGKLDGSAVLAHLSRTGSPNASPERLAALAGWASNDPAGARAWLESSAPDDARQQLAYGLLDGWALQDFDGAAAYALGLPRSETREQIRRLLFERCLAAGDVPAAQEWLASLPDDEHNRIFKQRTFNDIVSTMLLRDPSAAARWISQLNNPSLLNAESITQTAAKLAETAPAESLRWLDSLPPNDLTIAHLGYSEAVSAWSRQNPEAAGTWLREKAAHPAYDAMAAAHARAISADDVPTAIAWANSVTDADARHRGLVELAREVINKQGDGGRTALLDAGVNAEILDQSKEHAMYASFAKQFNSIELAGRLDQFVKWEFAARDEARSRNTRDPVMGGPDACP